MQQELLIMRLKNEDRICVHAFVQEEFGAEE
jgi:hypothetical protein